MGVHMTQGKLNPDRSHQMIARKATLIAALTLVSSCGFLPHESCDDAPTLLVHWNRGKDKAIVASTTTKIHELIGETFNDPPLWSHDSLHSFGFNHNVPGVLAANVTDYEAATIQDVTTRSGAVRPVIEMRIKKFADAVFATKPEDRKNQQLSLIETQPVDGATSWRAGQVFDGHRFREPTFYQLQWIKFDEHILDRAKDVAKLTNAAGKPRKYWQMFWQVKASPDYRLRVQVVYDPTEKKLLVEAHDDNHESDDTLHINSGLIDVDLRYGSEDSKEGWNKFEVYMDRTRGDCSILRVRMNDVEVYNGTQRMYNGKRNVAQAVFYAINYSNSHLLVDKPGDTPAFPPPTIWIDDLQLWTAPIGTPD